MDITVKELKERMDAGSAPIMIDVREAYEWEMDHLPGVRKITLSSLPSKLDELENLKEDEIVMICRSGARSGRAVQYLTQMGFSGARNLKGGMLAWKEQIDKSFNVE